MKKNKNILRVLSISTLLLLSSCSIPEVALRNENTQLPTSYEAAEDTTNTALLSWRTFFTDNNLKELIDTALKNNQDLNIILREIAISQNEIMSREGEYQPIGRVGASAGADRSGKYTFNGMSEEDTRARSGDLPRYVGDHSLGVNFSWELDIWRKLRNAKDASAKRYLATVEAKNFVVTNLIAEIAELYYELLVLDNELQIVQQNIQLQKDALEMVKLQKDAGRVNQLAINRFEAQLINTQNLRFEIQQSITQNENRINFLVARSAQPIRRSSADFTMLTLSPLTEGVPSQLLANRPDVRQAEQLLEAAKLDVLSAKANFYPSVTLRAGIGFQSFNPLYLIDPLSITLNALGDIAAPLINQKAIQAAYSTASEKQMQAVINYEQTILNAYTEVLNQLAANKNYSSSFAAKTEQVKILNESIEISNNLFKSARADYTEVLLTQREALEAKMELIEVKKKQLSAQINTYKALGGGWR